MSEVVVELIRAGLRRAPLTPSTGPRGLPLVEIGRPVTAEDVRSLEDE
jgi:hypothetical protein